MMKTLYRFMNRNAIRDLFWHLDMRPAKIVTSPEGDISVFNSNGSLIAEYYGVRRTSAVLA